MSEPPARGALPSPRGPDEPGRDLALRSSGGAYWARSRWTVSRACWAEAGSRLATARM